MRALAVIALIGGSVRAQPTNEPARVNVELDAPDDVQLGEVVHGGDDTAYVCSAPCTTYLRPYRNYVVMGHQLTYTKPFMLPAMTAVSIQVDVGSPRIRVLGEVCETVGIAAAAFAVLTATATSNDGDRDITLAMAVVAVPLVLAGVEIARHGQTTVKLLPHVELDARRAAITF